VWASAGDLQVGDAGTTVHGTKPFCSGLGIVDRALVTARQDDSVVLVDLDARAGATVRHDRSTWRTSALAATRTGTVVVDHHPVAACDVVGAPGWYLARPGFWHGACGPAACWAGGAAGLVDAAEVLVDDDPHRRAHLGGLRAAIWTMQAVLDRAGDQIDDRPHDVAAAHFRALAVRHAVERLCTEVLDRFGRAFGPRPLVGDEAVIRRTADLELYLRQDHAERDLHQLGGLAPP
jgi:alkylation response protein AidB-like acyl-CoA dehydrogenase